MRKNFNFIGALCLVSTLSAGVIAGTASAHATESTTHAVAPEAGTCSGTVTDSTGEPVIGANVAVKGSTNAMVTNIDGQFSLKNVTPGSTIVVTYIGCKPSETVWNGQDLNILLEDEVNTLSEVVVTALGIKREKKALGYAMQEVKGDALLESHEPNIANALTGKISGVQIIKSSNGPAGSSKIQLRGSNSVTGSNQPLIVVDGVPLDNFTGADNNNFWNPSLDMGNGLSDINPEDIESMSVLKGASAAALYGSRAGNGVILITTKKGTQNPGLGITVSSTVSVENTFIKPKRQTSFYQGSMGAFDALAYDQWGLKYGAVDTDQNSSNYGNLIQVTDWAGRTGVARFYDNVSNFFRTGSSFTENVAFSQQIGKTSVYISATRLDDNSMIPGAKYNRTNLTTRVNSSFGKDDRWTIDAKVQYINTFAKNRPISGSNASNYFYSMYKFPTNLDITEFKQQKDPATGQMYWWQNQKDSSYNPYWQKDFNTNQDSRNRFLQNYSIKYAFTDWLDAEIKFGSDMYFTESETKLYSGSPMSSNGRYSFGESKFYENNYSFLITAQKDRFWNKLGGNANFGGNIMERKSTGVSSSLDELIVPDLFFLSNATAANRHVTQSHNHRKTNSLYGTVGLNWDSWVYLDATFRNDWSSTLSKKNRSFFYPSVNLSWIVTDMLNKNDINVPAWFNYGKVRVSYASVGNDLDPYSLYNTWSIGSDGNTGGIEGGMTQSVLYSDDVRSELIKSWEAGLEVRFFNNRLGLDVAWYKSNATRQLLSIPMNSLSGYSAMMINAGNIQNTGVEIQLNATPIETRDFNWNTNLNFSKNHNKIVELAPGIDTYTLGTFDNLSIYATAGGNYGEIWGTKYMRVEDPESPYFGKLLLNSSGLPQANPDKVKIGDQQADFLLGWGNQFSYKGFGLSFQIDGRFGGKMFSNTKRSLQAMGVAAETAPGGNRDNFIVDGVIANTDGSYSPSTIEVSQQNYWNAITTSSGNLGIGEANLYDATNIRLRNVSLAYSLSSRALRNTPFQKVKFGVSCNNVWMIYNGMKDVDPESVFATSTNASGFENLSSPTSRSFLFNLTIGF